MDAAQKSKFEALIRDRLTALDSEDALGSGAQATVALDQQSVGRLSRQDALLSQSMAKATQARRDLLRGALQAALVRLSEDEFGYCDTCGDDIAERRLELEPTVRVCIGCAS